MASEVDHPLATVLLDNGAVVEAFIETLFDVRHIDGGCYWEVIITHNITGYVIHTPEFEEELRRFGKI